MGLFQLLLKYIHNKLYFYFAFVVGFWINHLRSNFDMHYLKTLISYRTVNTLRLGYKNQSVNAVEGNNRCLF